MFQIVHSAPLKGVAAAAALLTASLTGGGAHAGEAVGTIGVEMTITSACLVNGAAQLQPDFGSAGKIVFAEQPGSFTQADAELIGSAGALSVLCSPGTAPLLTVGTGTNDDAGTRRMRAGTQTIAYQLFTDSARSNEIGIGQQIALGTADTAPISVPIFARAHSGGALYAAGTYTDTVQVTLSW